MLDQLYALELKREHNNPSRAACRKHALRIRQRYHR